MPFSVAMDPVDARHVAYLFLIRSHRVILDHNDCVYAIDISDVLVVSDPSQPCFQDDMPTLLIGSDKPCHSAYHTRQWLGKLMANSNFDGSTALRAFIAGERQLCGHSGLVANAGIIGGRARPYVRLLSALSQRIQHHYRTVPREARGGDFVDMLVLNEVLLQHKSPGCWYERRARQRIDSTAIEVGEMKLRFGFPVGTLQLPFWGEACSPEQRASIAVSWTNYTFAHKHRVPPRDPA
jgi:hypothetical protein